MNITEIKLKSLALKSFLFVVGACFIVPGTWAASGTKEAIAVTGAITCGTDKHERLVLQYTPATAIVDSKDSGNSPYARWKIGFANPGTYTVQVQGSEKFAVRFWTWPAGHRDDYTARGGNWPDRAGNGYRWSFEMTMDERWVGWVQVYPIDSAVDRAQRYSLVLSYPSCEEVRRLGGPSNPVEVLEAMLRPEELGLLDQSEIDQVEEEIVIDSDSDNNRDDFDWATATTYCKNAYGARYSPLPSPDGSDYECIELGEVELPCGGPGEPDCPTVPSTGEPCPDGTSGLLGQCS